MTLTSVSCSSRSPVWALLACTIVLTVGNAQAQTNNYRTVTVAADRPSRIAAHAEFKKDCSDATAPNIQVTTPPRNGVLTVAPGKLKVGAIKPCPLLSAPVQQIIYRPRPNFEGNDLIAYDVTKSNGTRERHTINIAVKKRAPPQDHKPTTVPL